jgi:4-alpha-glucanotransferase
LSSANSIERLLKLRGIAKEYRDHQGLMKEVPGESLHRVLELMGHTVSDPHSVETDTRMLDEREWRQVLPPVIVFNPARQRRIEMTVLKPLPVSLSWRLEQESGSVESGELNLIDSSVVAECRIDELDFCRLAVPLPFDPVPGYHDLMLTRGDGSVLAETRLIIVPQRCWEPASIAAGKKIWGLAVQLYGLRSARNWGIGDFRDLEDLVGVAALRGIDMIGLNPLHALFPSRPDLRSPYSPSSRRFLNVLYIAPESVAEMSQCSSAQTLLASPEFQDELSRLRSCDLVDYAGVGRCKNTILRLLFSEFEKNPLSERQKTFAIYIKKNSQYVEKTAIYYAIDEVRVADGESGGWRSWPRKYQEPDGPAVGAFKKSHEDEIRYYMYLQWLASQQIAAVEEAARKSGMRVGLYRDLAVGVDGGGADTWVDQELYLDGVTIGAPPDAIASEGQDWRLPPMKPDTLLQRAYQPFVDLLRENMPEGGAVRIDHVMALERLWWIPEGLHSADGTYVNYCLDDLVGIVALESQRRRCLVIGEDLGTVPATVRKAMDDTGMYSYRVLVYEQDSSGHCRRPEDYPRRSVVTITTHDLPPIAGFWCESDIHARQNLGYFSNRKSLDVAIRDRCNEKKCILEALDRLRLLEPCVSEHEQLMQTLAPAVLVAIQIFVARSNASLMIVRPEDWLGEEAPFNLPGTDREYPNWQRKLPIDLAVLLAASEYTQLCDRLAIERRRESAVPA